MINNYGQISPTYGLSGTNVQPKSTESSSTADIIASFKEILSVMKATSSMSASQQTDSGVSQLMAPLMLLLLEKLIEQQMDQDPSATTDTQQSSPATALRTTALGETSLATDQGAKPIPSGRPVEGGRLTQGSHAGHTALDIAVPVGTPIKTTMDGRVVHAGWNTQGYGNLVIVENGAYRTYYAHLSSIPVSVGDTVNAGTTIGLSGNTGNSTGPHLHYEIRKDKVTINPTASTLGTS